MSVRRDLVLLHGALGSRETLLPLAGALETDFNVHVPDFPGHGSRSHETGPCLVSDLVASLDDLLIAEALQQPVVFGYSLGGYVALAHALSHPGKIRGVLTLGTKFAWDPASAEQEIRLLQPDQIASKVPAFARVLQHRHGKELWVEVLAKTAALMKDLGQHPIITPETAPLLRIPVCIYRGSEDKMVTQAETQLLAKALPFGESITLSGIPHPIESADPEFLADQLRSYIDRMPI